MKNIAIGMAACIALVFGVVFFFVNGSTGASQRRFRQPFPGHSAGEDELVWIDNYSEAIAQAKATGKPLFLEFRCNP